MAVCKKLQAADLTWHRWIGLEVGAERGLNFAISLDDILLKCYLVSANYMIHVVYMIGPLLREIGEKIGEQSSRGVLG